MGYSRTSIKILFILLQEQYRSMLPMYYRNAESAIIIIDCTSINALNGADSWVKELNSRRNLSDLILVLAVNKCDKKSEYKINKSDIDSFCSMHNMHFFEVSALTGEGLNPMFEYIMSEFLKKESTNIEPEKYFLEEKKNKCCQTHLLFLLFSFS